MNKARELSEKNAAYEQGFIYGMAKQRESSVDRAVNATGKPWMFLTNEEKTALCTQLQFSMGMQAIGVARYNGEVIWVGSKSPPVGTIIYAVKPAETK